MDVFFINVVIPIARTVFVIAVVFLTVKYVLKLPIPRWAIPLALAAVVGQATLNILHTNGPRFTISDEAGYAPTVGGEIKTLAPDKMTDSERLQFNRDIYLQNEMKEKQ